MLRRNMVDGVIVNSLNIGAEAYAEMGLSLVGIDCDLGEGSVQIASDSYGIGELATRRLIDDGCRRILCLRSNSRMRMPANKRTDAYHDVVEQAGLPALVREVEFVKSDDEKSAVVAKILDENPDIDGIFAGDDTMAAICLNVMKQRGLSAPDDIKVVGADGARRTMTFMPDLTTVRQDRISSSPLNSLRAKPRSSSRAKRIPQTPLMTVRRHMSTVCRRLELRKDVLV